MKNKPDPRYIIVLGASAFQLADHVNQQLADGYEPIGGPMYEQNMEQCYWQAMYKLAPSGDGRVG